MCVCRNNEIVMSDTFLFNLNKKCQLCLEKYRLNRTNEICYCSECQNK